MGGKISGSSIQFHWSTCLLQTPCSFYHYCSLSLLEVRCTDSNRSTFLVDNSLSYPGFLLFQMNLRIALSNSVKNWVVILTGIALNLYIAFGSMVILTLLILPIKEHRKISIFWCLHAFLSSKTWSSCYTELWFVWLESHQDTLDGFLAFPVLSISIFSQPVFYPLCIGRLLICLS